MSEEEVEKYLYGTYLDMYPPELMLGMEDAAAIMAESIALKKKSGSSGTMMWTVLLPPIF